MHTWSHTGCICIHWRFTVMICVCIACMYRRCTLMHYSDVYVYILHMCTHVFYVYIDVLQWRIRIYIAYMDICIVHMNSSWAPMYTLTCYSDVSVYALHVYTCMVHVHWCITVTYIYKYYIHIYIYMYYTHEFVTMHMYTLTCFSDVLVNLLQIWGGFD